jgi:ketosteroid isomerase-like protein
MSSENVEFIKGLMGAFGGTDLNADAIRELLPAAIAETCDPEIEFVETPERVDARTYHGHEGALEAWTRWLDQWEEYSAEPQAYEDHGDDVLVIAREQGTGPSGATVGATLFLIFTIRNNKILRYREFYDEDAARAALAG